MKALALPLLAVMALTACGSEADNVDEQPVVAGEAASGTPSPAPEPSAPAATPTAIPAAALGRWGLVPADCEPGRADAKGLLTIEPNRLRFYESVGTLGTITEGSPTSLRAAFAFTGEGMTWQRDMTLEVQDDGRTLIRREYGDDAAPDPFRYTKCS